jgi:phosphoesterase RecJ-like protein
MKKEILAKIEAYDTIIVHGHTRPDGDCYGAGYGLKYTIEETYPNKTVYYVGESTTFYDYIGSKDDISDDTYQGALAIIVDTATKTRVSDDRWRLADFAIKIDHHIPVDDYGDLIWVDTSFPACSLMVTEFINDFKDILKVPKKAAVALYTGIVTDTGNFIYRGVGAKTMNLAATLLDYGVNVYDDVMKNVNRRPLVKVKFEGYVLQNFEISSQGFAYIKLPLSVQEEYGVSNEIAAASVSLLSDIEGVSAWGAFIEYPNTSVIRGRIRSSDLEIDQLANKYQGGGHKYACGTNHDSWENIDEFIIDMDKVIKKKRSE